jgi:hypothetical protein
MFLGKIILVKVSKFITIALFCGKTVRARVSFREIPQHWLITIAAFCKPQPYSSINNYNLQTKLRSPRRN